MSTVDAPREETTPEARPLRRGRLQTTAARAWREAAVVVVAVRAVALPLSLAAAAWLTTQPGVAPEGLEIWARWDASDHFFRVATDGYTGPEADPLGTAFFPLFPLLLRGFSAAGLSLVVAGLIIAAVSSVVAFAYLYRLAEEELGEGAGHKAVLYLALFPTAVFLIAPTRNRASL